MDQYDTLIRLRGGDSRLAPVFVCHDAAGDVNSSVRLARLLGGERPVYGIKARVAEDGSPLDTTVENMAEAAVALVSSIQPESPYTLIGYSFGSVVAFEAARILEQSGQEVDRVVLLDPYVGDGCLRPAQRIWYLSVKRPWSVVRWLATVDWPERGRFLRRVITRLLPWADPVLPRMTETSPTTEMVGMAETAVSALEAYRPRSLAAPVTIVNCTQKFPCMCDPLPVLLDAVDKNRTDLRQVNGSHPDMMTEPGVHETAKIINGALGHH